VAVAVADLTVAVAEKVAVADLTVAVAEKVAVAVAEKVTVGVAEKVTVAVATKVTVAVATKVAVAVGGNYKLAQCQWWYEYMAVVFIFDYLSTLRLNIHNLLNNAPILSIFTPKCSPLSCAHNVTTTTQPLPLVTPQSSAKAIYLTLFSKKKKKKKKKKKNCIPFKHP
jgi:hypothetical protein